MSEITNPRELFLHELGDILYVERNLVEEALPKLIDEVQDAELKTGLKAHLAQTRQHVSNVEQVFELLGETPHEEECIAFEGLKKEHEEMVKESSSYLIDLVDLGAAARTENYEIAAYEGLRRMAKALGEEKAVELLNENLSLRRRKRFARSKRSRHGSATSRSRQQRHNVQEGLGPRFQPLNGEAESDVDQAEPAHHAVRAPPGVGSPTPLSVLGSLAAEPEPHVSVSIWTSAVNAVRCLRQVGPPRFTIGHRDLRQRRDSQVDADAGPLSTTAWSSSTRTELMSAW